MRTLAEKLGVTTATISLALRSHPSISKATRERVTQLANQWNYRPDPAIAAIASRHWSCETPKRHRVIAFLHRRDSIHATFLSGARDRAADLGYKIEPIHLEEYPNAEALSRVLYARGIRGVIVAPIQDPRSRLELDLEWGKFTAVCCGVGRVHPPLHVVNIDVFAATRKVWKVVAEAGFQRIGAAINCHTPVSEDDWQRIGASSAAIQILGLESAESIPFLVCPPSDEKALIRWYHRYQPEVIVGFNSSTGEMLRNNGIRIPEDVSFISLKTPIHSDWSGIVDQCDEVGRRSVEILNHEIRENRWGLPTYPNITLIESKWNLGSTFRGESFRALSKKPVPAPRGQDGELIEAAG
jgi:DNA-binding LacI/PurR family transcriptional regulator